jgi:ubiquinone/menaquinone biosynthesis C-methylase UbiE
LETNVSQLALAQPNSPYVDFWNTVLVPKFDQWRHILVGGLGLHSAKVFPQLKLATGNAVLDVGCGWGETAIEIARRVGPGGRVVGLDCCDAFLAAGRADAAKAGVRNVSFVAADVETYPLAPEFDVCFSRFGTQFFQNPVAGLRNMRRGLKPGGIMTMIVWRARADNPWLERAKKVLLCHLPPVAEDAASCGPGPFSMADPQVVTKQMEIAGYAEPKFERIDADVMVGRNVEEAIAFQLAIGPAGEVYRAAGAEAERKRDTLVRALEEELRDFARPEGVMMASSSWLVTARNPS